MAVVLVPPGSQTKTAVALADAANLNPTPTPLASAIPTPTPSIAPKPTAKAPAPVAAAVSSRYGIAAGSSFTTLSAAELGRRLDDIKSLGSGWIRFDVEWANIEHDGQGQFNWTDTDRVISAASARGFKIIGILDYSPPWARNPACASSFACAPADPATYARFAGIAAAHYPAIRAWEVWNEPNSADYFKPAADPVAYTALLRGAHDAIKAANPSATVLTGGLSPASTGGGFISPPDFVTRIYQAGARGAFDALGDHPYTYPVTVTYPMPANAWGQMTQLHNIMASYGDGALQVWATEYGAPTGGPGSAASTNNYTGSTHVTEAMQALAVTDLFRTYSALPWAGPLLWYTYQDAGTSSDTNENFFGLVRADGSHKPAYASYKQALASYH